MSIVYTKTSYKASRIVRYQLSQIARPGGALSGFFVGVKVIGGDSSIAHQVVIWSRCVASKASGAMVPNDSLMVGSTRTLSACPETIHRSNARIGPGGQLAQSSSPKLSQGLASAERPLFDPCSVRRWLC